MRGYVVSRREQRLERRRIFRRRPALDIVKRVCGQSKVSRAQRSLAYAPVVEQFPQVRVSRAGNLVEAFGSAYNIRAFYARSLESRDEGRPEDGLGDTEDHATRAHGVEQWAKGVEERAKGQRASRWG